MALMARRDLRGLGRVTDPKAARRAGTKKPATEATQRERDRAKRARLLRTHAPPDWEERFRRDQLLNAIIDGEPIQMFVLAADSGSPPIS